MFGKRRDKGPDERPTTTHTEGPHTGSHAAPATTESRGEVVDREREEHGGVKVGSAFFGWLAATGMAVLLTAIVAATGLLAGDANDTDSASEAAGQLNIELETLGVAAVVVALVIWFVSYYAGGFVAGRMARFDGIKQGIAVWVWAIVIAVIVTVIGYVADRNTTAGLGGPAVTIDDATSTRLVIGVVVLLLVSLVGAMLGGLAGMRFHRRVDRTGLGR